MVEPINNAQSVARKDSSSTILCAFVRYSDTQLVLLDVMSVLVLAQLSAYLVFMAFGSLLVSNAKVS